jgi:hypothetical protein
MTNKTNKQSKENKTQKYYLKKNLYCWMKLVGVVSSSSTCTRE